MSVQLAVSVPLLPDTGHKPWVAFHPHGRHDSRALRADVGAAVAKGIGIDTRQLAAE